MPTRPGQATWTHIHRHLKWAAAPAAGLGKGGRRKAAMPATPALETDSAATCGPPPASSGWLATHMRPDAASVRRAIVPVCSCCLAAGRLPGGHRLSHAAPPNSSRLLTTTAPLGVALPAALVVSPAVCGANCAEHDSCCRNQGQGARNNGSLSNGAAGMIEPQLQHLQMARFAVCCCHHHLQPPHRPQLRPPSAP